MVLSVVCVLVPGACLGSPSGALREYKSGKYQPAFKEYEQSAARRTADDPRLHFNAGAAAYRDGQFDEAARHFNQALNAPDLKLQEQAYYNLGNTLYRVGPAQGRIRPKNRRTGKSRSSELHSSLKLNPQDADAKSNYPYVKQRLEELKKQQQQKQNQSDQNKDQKKNDQKEQKQNEQNQQGQKQQQDQKNQKSEQNQQQNSKNQEQQNKSSEDQQRKSSENEQQKQNPSEQDKKQQEGQQEKQSPEQQKKQQAAKSAEQQKKEDEARQANQAAYAAGQMTPQQARQLLDAQRGNELLLPAKPDQKAATRNGPVKDW